jgi:hypothetical protein
LPVLSFPFEKRRGFGLEWVSNVNPSLNADLKNLDVGGCPSISLSFTCSFSIDPADKNASLLLVVWSCCHFNHAVFVLMSQVMGL